MNMGMKVVQFLLRFGPLVAAWLVGIQAVPELSKYVAPDPEVSRSVTDLVTYTVLLVGAARKTYSMITK